MCKPGSTREPTIFRSSLVRSKVSVLALLGNPCESLRAPDFLGGLIDAAVIHGGEGTVQTMCSIGVPFAGIGLQAEQRINIDECVRHGNALALTPRQVRRGMLPGVVDTLLHDAALRDTAADLAGWMSDYDGAATSARLIADYVARESRESRES